MPRRKEEGKRKKILDAATRIFARKGFHGANISDIAHEAGVAHGTVYTYFGSKDDLLASIFHENLSELVGYVRSEVQNEKNAEAKFRRMIALQIKLIEQNPELTELMLVEFPRTGKFLDHSTINTLSAYIDMIADVLKEGMAEGTFDDTMDIDVVATMIYSAIQGIATRWILYMRQYPLIEKVTDEVSNVFLKGIKVESERG